MLSKLINWVDLAHRSALSGQPSSKRLNLLVVTASLVFALMSLDVVCAIWIAKHGDLGSGATTALLGLAGAVAGLASVSYRKADNSSVGTTQSKGDDNGVS